MNKKIDWQNLFNPRTVAVIGASNSRGSWGYNAMNGLLNVEGRTVYPVNPTADEVLGFKSYKSVVDIPEPVDLAVIVVAAPRVPQVMNECVAKGIKAGIIITAGFAELEGEGERLQAEVVRIAKDGGLHFIGPNSLGHADNHSRLSTFGQAGDTTPGPVAVLSQSGSTCFKIVRNGMAAGVTFGKYVSTGNEASLCMEDYLEYLNKDDDTKIISAYIEGLRDGKRFVRLAREITRHKPIVVVKIGSTEESARAVRSHTGALAGADEVYTAAFKQSGVIRTEDDDELCDVLYALICCPLPDNNRISILSIGGGQGALTAEVCLKEGMALANITSSTVKKLDEYLPSRWSHCNPVDMAGTSPAENNVAVTCLHALLEDEDTGIIFLQTPIVADKTTLRTRMGMTPDEIETYLKAVEKHLTEIRIKIEKYRKPVVLVGIAGSLSFDPEVVSLLRKVKIPVIPNSRRAARVMKHLYWYGQYLDALNGK